MAKQKEDFKIRVKTKKIEVSDGFEACCKDMERALEVGIMVLGGEDIFIETMRHLGYRPPALRFCPWCSKKIEVDPCCSTK